MMVIRLLFIFILIAIIVLLGLYLVTKDKRYLLFSFQVAKFLFILLVVSALIYSVTRIILY
jgi:hypothetical protein